MARGNLGDLDGAETVSEDNPYIVEPETDLGSVDEVNEEEASEQVEYLREAIRFHD
jgi:DNA ligase (NAD+)